MPKEKQHLPQIRELMIPIKDYATVPHTATLGETMNALQNEKKRSDQQYRHRSVLVVDDKGRVVGKVSQMDILRALEPKYSTMGSDFSLSRLGFSTAFIKTLENRLDLWNRSFKDILGDMDRIPVTEVMYKPSEHQHVKINDSLTTAIHQIVMGRHQSLLVTDKKKVIGILPATDVYQALYDLLVKIRG